MTWLVQQTSDQRGRTREEVSRPIGEEDGACWGASVGQGVRKERKGEGERRDMRPFIVEKWGREGISTA